MLLLCHFRVRFPNFFKGGTQNSVIFFDYAGIDDSTIIKRNGSLKTKAVMGITAHIFGLNLVVSSDKNYERTIG